MKRRTLNVIETLAKFYDVILCSDEERESDANEVMLQNWTVVMDSPRIIFDNHRVIT